jgi:hypothetical protein
MDRSTTESKVSACLTTLLEVGLESAQYALALPEIMQQCMHTHELDYYAASALPLCSISIRILCCPFQHWQCMHRTTKMALEGWKVPWIAKLESLLLAHAEVAGQWLLATRIMSVSNC